MHYYTKLSFLALFLITSLTACKAQQSSSSEIASAQPQPASANSNPSDLDNHHSDSQKAPELHDHDQCAHDGCGAADTAVAANEEHHHHDHDHDHGDGDDDDDDCAAHAHQKLPDSILPGQTKSYGAPLSLTSKPISMAEAINHFKQNDGKTIKLEGKVDKVCSAMGCWMTFKDDKLNQSIRINMKGHSFFVPRNSKGATAIAQGTLSQHVIPKELLQNYAKQTHSDQPAPDHDVTEYVFVADGVQLSMPNS